ncbi:MAG: hypothetical protein AB8G99_13350 [Planctomycetaceae bacterium]
MGDTNKTESLLLVGLTVLAILIVGCWWHVSQSRAAAQKQQVAETIRRLAADGEPIDVAGLRRKWNEVRPTDPGTSWAKAFAAYAAVPPPTTDLPFVGSRFVGSLFVSESKLADPDCVAQCRDYLAANSSALRLFHNAAHTEETPPPRYMGRRAFSLLRLHVAISAMDENWEAVCRGLVTQLTLLKLSDNTDCTQWPARVGLSRVLAQAVYFDIIQYCPQIPRPLLASVAEALEGADYLGGYCQELRAARVSGILVFTDQAEAKAQFEWNIREAAMEDKESLTLWQQLDLHKAGLADNFDLYLEIIDSLLDATESPLHELLPLSQRFARDARLESTSANTVRILVVDRNWDEDRNDEFLNYPLNPRGTVSVIARQSLCRLAIAAIQFYHDHHRWPMPSDLVPDYLAKVPVDPYSGRDLLLREVGDRLRLYSVGHNCLDDDGAAGQDVDWWYWDGTERDLVVDLSPPKSE